MSDLQPTESTLPAGDADREARIEELLLSGLDHYFAGQYERAISVWTRVIFLERQHNRARAYIERARSALAERQRESEELLHTGIAAYNAGEIERARDFLSGAVERGSDTADVFLDRLDRLGRGMAGVEQRPDAVPVRPRRAAEPLPPTARRGSWIAVTAGAMVVATGMLVGGLPIGSWLSNLGATTPAAVTETSVAEPLPIVRASEIALARARTLHADRHFLEALRTLERIDIADPLREDANRLRADIQRDQLSASGIGASSPGQLEFLP